MEDYKIIIITIIITIIMKITIIITTIIITIKTTFTLKQNQYRPVNSSKNITPALQMSALSSYSFSLKTSGAI
jgi:hypothetical protein